MKLIVIMSSCLLGLGAIYGFVDYKKQNKSGALKDLYKDKEFNAQVSIT